MKKLILVLILICASFVVADDMAMKPIANAAGITWGACPEGLPPGCKAAVLLGDPGNPDEYVIRAWFPDGYKIPAHFHPTAENLTILSGTFNVGMGDKLDMTKTQALTAGGFATMGKEMHHFAWIKGETVIQVNGIGPFMITYINPADDPRPKK